MKMTSSISMLFSCLFLLLSFAIHDTSAFVKGTCGVPQRLALVNQASTTTSLYAAAKGGGGAAKKTKKVAMKKMKKVVASKSPAKTKAASKGPANLKKSEFIESVAEKTGMTKADTDRAITAILDTIVEEVVQGKRVAFNGFGSFTLSERKARTGRNPQTGEPLQIAASMAPKFTASSKFKDIANGRE